MSKNIVPIIVAIVIVGATSFYGGTLYQKSRTQPFGGRGNFRNSQFPSGSGVPGISGGNRQVFDRPVEGEILSLDENGITVRLNDGSSKIVLISDSTKLNQSHEIKKEDLTVGKQVTIFGNTNSGNTISALTINLNP